jgi:hypothetical protein
VPGINRAWDGHPAAIRSIKYSQPENTILPAQEILNQKESRPLLALILK